MSERVCVICRFTQDEVEDIKNNTAVKSSAEGVEAFVRKNMTRLGIDNRSTATSDAIENGETEEVHAMWDADMPDVKSDAAAEIIEDIFRKNEGRHVRAEFIRTENGEPVFAVSDLPAGQTAADLRASRDEDEKAIAHFRQLLSTIPRHLLEKAFTAMQEERTRRNSSKSKAARRAEKQKRKAKSVNADDWNF